MKYLTIFLLFTLSACAGNPETTLLKTPKEQAISFFITDVSINGEKANAGAHCFPFLRHESDSLSKRSKSFRSTLSGAIISEPGQIEFFGIHCTQRNILIARERMHHFTPPLTFKAEAGKINYGGRVVIDYTMKGYTPFDVIGNFPTSPLKEDVIKLSLEKDIENGKHLYKQLYGTPPEGFAFKGSYFENNPQFNN